MVASFHGSMKLIKGNGRSLGSQRVLFGPDTGQLGLSNIRWQERFASGADGWRDLELDSPANAAALEPGQVIEVIESPAGDAAVAGAAGVITMRAYGALGDGTDQSAELLEMAEAVAALGGGTILGEPGALYSYTNSAWTAAFGAGSRVTIDLQGASLRCTAEAGSFAYRQPVNFRRLYQDFPVSGTPTYDARHLIETVAAGATTIECITPANAALYTAGDRIFIGGRFVQRNAYPPDLLFFESAEVASVAGAVITLTAPLRWSYRQDWPERAFEASEQIGPAHIVRDSRLDYLEIKNGHILPNPNYATGFYFYPVARSVLISGLDAPDVEIVPSMTDKFVCRSSRWLRTEPDKTCDDVTFEDTTFIGTDYSAGQASSVRRLRFRRCDLPGGVWCNPIDLLGVEDCDVGQSSDLVVNGGYGAIRPYGLGSIKRVEVLNNRFHSKGALLHCINNGVGLTMTARGGSATTLLLNDDDTDFDAMQALHEGDVIFKTDGTKYGRIAQVHVSGGNIALTGEFSAAPANAETWRYHQAQEIDAKGNTLPAGIPLYRYLRSTLRQRVGEPLILTEKDIAWASADVVYFEPIGTILSIEVLVTRAYSGADSAPKLMLYATDAFDELFTIDLLTTGRRVATTGGLAGSAGADTAGALGITTHLGIHLVPQNSGGSGLDDLTGLPQVLIRVETACAI